MGKIWLSFFSLWSYQMLRLVRLFTFLWKFYLSPPIHAVSKSVLLHFFTEINYIVHASVVTNNACQPLMLIYPCTYKNCLPRTPKGIWEGGIKFIMFLASTVCLPYIITNLRKVAFIAITITRIRKDHFVSTMSIYCLPIWRRRNGKKLKRQRG